jgi:NAD-dependent dihydropyrimidine dehydrogenase PreA subunit
MADPYVITSPCLDTKDRACVDVCPVQCIYELQDDTLVSRHTQDGEVAETHPAHPEIRFVHGDAMLYINPDECTSCDACLPECPVDAIHPGDRVPEDQRDFIDINRYVFADISA